MNLLSLLSSNTFCDQNGQETRALTAYHHTQLGVCYTKFLHHFVREFLNAVISSRATIGTRGFLFCVSFQVSKEAQVKAR